MENSLQPKYQKRATGKCSGSDFLSQNNCHSGSFNPSPLHFMSSHLPRIAAGQGDRGNAPKRQHSSFAQALVQRC